MDKLITVIEGILILLLAVAIGIVGTQIIFRYVFDSPLSWSEQGARCIFIWLTMLSVPCIFRRKGMIAFDLIINNLPDKVKSVLEIVVQLIVLFFAVYYFYYSLMLCISTGSRVMAGVAIPQNLMYISQPISMAFLILVMIEQFIQTVTKLRGGEAK